MSDHDHVTDLFNRAAELSGPERSAFLDRECVDDPALREEIEGLLGYDADPHSLLATAGGERIAALDSIPETIGPYDIVDKIGEGGMGIVFRGLQREPIERPVAVKLVRTTGNSFEMLARCESERHALSRMNHPGIATVFDAGVTQEGTPYIVMEYVEGRSITKYCDDENLGLEQRLSLFAKVCDAVQHAHRNAIIHRDIKPSNVMIVDSDGAPQPKIIDFGIAKAIENSKRDGTITQIGQMVGTPEYMSPEQAGVTDHAVDTRTDVYSLGILLYRLVVGALPYDTDTLKTLNLRRFASLLAEADPTTPSRRVRELGSGARDIALSHRLSGDIDWIVVKAISREPARRYGSATELAQDIRRHLENRPVLATPPSFGYVAKKFVRRHRSATAFATIVLALLITAGTILGIQARRIVEERNRATEFSDLLVDLFDLPWDRLHRISSDELITRSFDRLVERLEHRPVLRGRALISAGIASDRLGYGRQASRRLAEAYALLREHVGETHPWTLDAQAWYGFSLRRSDSSEASRVIAGALQLQSDQAERSDPAVIETAMSLAEVNRLDRPDQALAQARDAASRLGDDTPLDLRVRVSDVFVSSLIENRQFDEALRIADETLELDSAVLNATGLAFNRATALAGLGRRAEALDALGQVVGTDAPHPNFDMDRNFISLWDDPRFRELATIARFRTRESRDAAYVLARKAYHQGRPATETTILETIYLFFLHRGSDAHDFDRLEENLAAAYLRADRPEMALPHYERLLERLEQFHNPSNLWLLNIRSFRAAAHAGTGDTEKAIQMLEDVVETVTTDEIGFSRVQAARIQTLRGDLDGALATLERVAEDRVLHLWLPDEDPIFEPLKTDPRFDRLMDRMFDEIVEILGADQNLGDLIETAQESSVNRR
jgi:serine/threonine protein kinase